MFVDGWPILAILTIVRFSRGSLLPILVRRPDKEQCLCESERPEVKDEGFWSRKESQAFRA